MTQTKSYYTQCHFRGQLDGEKILHVVRRHWFNIFIQFIPVIVFLFLWVTALILIPASFPTIIENYTTLFWFLASTFLIFIWFTAAVIWVDYYLDVWIITNLRIVNVEQKGFFLRHVSELRYWSVQDVTTKVGGMLPTLLNYGDITVQTAGTDIYFVFRSVPDPYAIKAEIINLQKKTNNQSLTELQQMIQNKQT
ncbi:MAG: PH domain-containing protein [Candidatus Moranbacteria bacterium]|nr:PH domain-containing protein [Candidatus Moranbacteria bacterium]